jgi:hypothetical protein
MAVMGSLLASHIACPDPRVRKLARQTRVSSVRKTDKMSAGPGRAHDPPSPLGRAGLRDLALFRSLTRVAPAQQESAASSETSLSQGRHLDA